MMWCLRKPTSLYLPSRQHGPRESVKMKKWREPFVAWRMAGGGGRYLLTPTLVNLYVVALEVGGARCLERLRPLRESLQALLLNDGRTAGVRPREGHHHRR